MTPPDGAVDILWLHSTPTPHNNYLLDTVAALPGVSLTRFYCTAPTAVSDRPWTTVTAGDVPGGGIWTDLGRWWDWRVLRRVLAATPPVLFVVGWDVPLLVLVLLVAGVRRAPLLMWDDGPSPATLAHVRSWKPKPFLKRLLIRMINRTTGTYFVTGELARSQAEAIGIAPDKQALLPFFVRPGRRDAALRTQWCPDDRLLVFAGGRLIPEKGFDLLIEALGHLRAEAPHLRWHLVLAGSGPEADHIGALVTRLGLTDLVTILPWAEPDVFANLIHTADIFVAPARHDHFPTTVIAALQAGTPVVATTGVGSALEFVVDGRNGRLVAAGDSRALTRALQELAADEGARQQLAAAGRRSMAQWPVSRGAALIAEAARRASAGEPAPCP